MILPQKGIATSNADVKYYNVQMRGVSQRHTYTYNTNKTHKVKLVQYFNTVRLLRRWDLQGSAF